MYSSKPVTYVRRMLLHRAFQCRRKRSSAVAAASNAKVVNNVRHVRGEYSCVTDADVRHFRSLLGEPNVLTGAENVGPYNVDYMKQASGKDNCAALFTVIINVHLSRGRDFHPTGGIKH